jgi:hypothetical protein
MAVAALFVALTPMASAQAAAGPDQAVHVQLNSTDTYGALARLTGTVAFDDTSTYRYALRLCWQKAYPAPSFRIIVNGGTQVIPVESGSVAESGCQRVFLYNATRSGGIVQNVRFDVTGGWFDFSNQYRTRTRSSATYDNPFN